MMNLLDLMNELGSRVRYGVGPNEKYKLMASGATPGQPQAFMPSGEVNPQAERYLSNYLGAQQWGQGPATLFNQIRYLIDNYASTFGAGVKGAEKSNAAPLQALLAQLASGAVQK
jgi:hypothetical protein